MSTETSQATAKVKATSTHFNAVRAAMKRAGFVPARRVRLEVPNRYGGDWIDGFRVAPTATPDITRVFYQKVYYTAHDAAVERQQAELYRAALEQAGYICYIDGRRQVIVAGIRGVS